MIFKLYQLLFNENIFMYKRKRLLSTYVSIWTSKKYIEINVIRSNVILFKNIM